MKLSTAGSNLTAFVLFQKCSGWNSQTSIF